MNLFSLNATLIAELAIFAIVVVVVAKLILPPLRQAMNDRQSTIRKGLADAEAAEVRLSEAEAEYERRLVSARREGREILDAYRAMGAAQVEDAKQEAGETH